MISAAWNDPDAINSRQMNRHSSRVIRLPAFFLLTYMTECHSLYLSGFRPTQWENENGRFTTDNTEGFTAAELRGDEPCVGYPPAGLPREHPQPHGSDFINNAYVPGMTADESSGFREPARFIAAIARLGLTRSGRLAGLGVTAELSLQSDSQAMGGWLCANPSRRRTGPGNGWRTKISANFLTT